MYAQRDLQLQLNVLVLSPRQKKKKKSGRATRIYIILPSMKNADDLTSKKIYLGICA